MNRRLRRLLIAGAALAVAIALALMGLFPQDPLRRLAERRLAEALGATVRVGRLRVVPGALRVLAEDVVIDGPTWRAEARRIEMTLKRATLSGALVLRRLTADGLRVTAAAAAPAASPAARPSPLQPIRIDELALRDAQLVYSAPELGLLRLEGISARGAIGGETLELTLTEGILERPRPLRFSGHGRFVVEADLDTAIEELRIETARSTVRARGKLGSLRSPAPELDLQASTDLAEVAGLAGLEGMAGAVSVTAHVAERVRAEAEGHGLEIAGQPIARAAVAIDHGADATTFIASAGVLGGTLESDGRLAGGRVSARFRFRELGLAPLARASGAGSLTGDPGGALQVAATFETAGSQDGTELHGTGQVRGSITTRTRALDLEWSASVAGHAPRLTALTAEAQGTARGPWPATILGAGSGRAVVQGPGGPLDASFEAAISGQAETLAVELHGSVATGALAARLELAGGRLARVSGEGSGFELARFFADIAGTAAFRADLRDPLERATGQAHVDLSAFAFMGTAVGEAGVDATFERGRMQAILDAPELKLRGEAALAAGQRRLEGALELSGTSLDPLGAAFKRPELRGTATGRARFAVPLDDPRTGTLDVERLVVASGGSELTLAGTFGLAPEAPLGLSASGTIDLASAPLPEGVTLTGRTAVDLRVIGRTDAPVVEGTLRLDGVRAAGTWFPAFDVQSGLVTLQRDRILLDPPLIAEIAGGQASLAGVAPFAAFSTRLRRGPLTDSQRARLQVTWSGIDGAALRPPSEAGASWTATLSGDAMLEGGFASAEELSLTARAAVANARAGDLPFEVSPVELSLERGRITLSQVEVSGAGATLTLSGFRDVAAGDQDLRAIGGIDLRALAPLLDGTSLGGQATLDVRYGGRVSGPHASGTIRIADASLRHRSLPQALTSLNALLSVDDTGLRLSEASALLGGGTLSATGGVTLAGDRDPEVAISLQGREMTLRYPEGMRSRVDADMRLLGTPAALRLEGEARVRGGVYDLDTLLTSRAEPPAGEPSALLRRITLDLSVTTQEPIMVRSASDLARIEAIAQISIRGDLAAPEPYGRVELTPGGRVKLASRVFLVESGTVTYQGDWNAALNIRARGRVRNASEQRDYDVTVALGGTTDNAELHFSSDPPESEGRIVSLVTTGQFGSAGFESGGRAMGDQLAGLFATRYTRGLASGLGLDEITIQPELISRETDPGARFTFGKQLTDRIRLIQSWSLNDPEGRFTQLEGTPGRDVTVMAQRLDDGSYTGGLGQRFRFGGAPWQGARPEERVRIAQVEFETNQPFREAELRRGFGIQANDRVAPSAIQDAADELRQRLIDAGHIEAEVGARLADDHVQVRVSAGPLVLWRVVGAARPSGFDAALRDAMSVEDALETGRELLLEQERESGHLRAEVAASTSEEHDRRILLFEVRPGPVLQTHVEFPGASGLSKQELLAAAGGPAALLTSPDAAVGAIREAYRRAFFLAAEVDAASIVERGPQLTIVVPVREGPRAVIREVIVRGSTLSDEDARRALRLRPGRTYSEERATAAAVRLRIKQLEAGYPDTRVARAIEPAGSDVDVIFDVSPGERLTIGAIEIEGARRTRIGLVKDQLQLEPGDPLDVRALTRAEQRLLDLGAFRRSVITWNREQPALVNVELTEDARLITGYEARYNDDAGGSIQLDAEVRNLFGRAVSLGTRYRIGTQENELRSSLYVPSAFRLGDVALSAFRSYEELEIPEVETPDVRRENGVQIQQTIPFQNRWNLLYGYRFRRVTFESPFLPLPITENIAALEASVVREGRDNPINARRGHFLSLSVERAGLASDFKFLKTLSQAFINKRLNRRITWSQGYRLGLAWGRGGQRVVQSELFQAGGANSLRPFGEDSVGPRNIFGQVVGGEGLLIFNQELRFFHSSGLGAAVFYDAGNVFDRVSDISLKLRHGAGVGIRYDSPIGMLRIDAGFPFDRREGDDSYQLYFSLGQAF